MLKLFYLLKLCRSDFEVHESGPDIAKNAYYERVDISGKLTILSGVNRIRDRAFYGCVRLTGSPVFPETLTEIATEAFKGCQGLGPDVNLPSSLTTLEPSAFLDCNNIVNFIVNGNNFKSSNGIIYNTDLDAIIRCPCGRKGTVTFTDTTKSIGSYAFYGCILLTGDLVIPNTIVSIGEHAFEDCFGLDGTLSLPDSIDYIPDHCFKNCNFKGQLTIPTSVLTLGSGAFEGCKYFSGDLNIPESVINISSMCFYDACFGGSLILTDKIELIDSKAFEGCKITGSLILPNNPNYTSIKEKLFYGCRFLTGELIIPERVTEIGEQSFCECIGLTKVIIPQSVTVILDKAFCKCTSLESIDVNENNAVFRSENGIVFTNNPNELFICPAGKTGQITIPEGVTSIFKYAFYFCSKLTGSLTIPDSVTIIGFEAFKNCIGLTGSLKLSNTLETIFDFAFMNCGFTGSLNLPNTLIKLSEAAFAGCVGLTGKVIFPDNQNFIFENYLAFPFTVFDKTGIDSFYISENSPNYKTDDGILYTNDGTELVLCPPCKTGELKILDGVETIDNAAFKNCVRLVGELVIPTSVTTISMYAFDGCVGLTGKLVIPDHVSEIGESAFSGCCGFTGPLTIPSEVNKICISAFSGCSGFTGPLTIPSEVSEIGISAFKDCIGFTGTLTLPGDLYDLYEGAFGNCNFDNIVFDPESAYFTFQDGILYDSESKSIYFCLKSKTGNLKIPNTVKYIKKDAFYGCDKLTGDLEIPYSVTTIEPGAFAKCTGFNGNLNISESVQTISGAFEGCTGLQNILLNKDNFYFIEKDGILYSRGYRTIHFCIPSKSGPFSIPPSVIFIDIYAFSGCSKLTGQLVIPESVYLIGDYAFEGCSGFDGTLTINSPLTEIGPFTFSGCSKIETVQFAKTIEIVNSSSFAGCQNLKNYIVPEDNIFLTSINGVLYSKNKEIIISYPAGKEGEIELQETTKCIESLSFAGCNKLTGSLFIPEGLSFVGKDAFAGCGGYNGILFNGLSNPYHPYEAFRRALNKNVIVKDEYVDNVFCGIPIVHYIKTYKPKSKRYMLQFLMVIITIVI